MPLIKRYPNRKLYDTEGKQYVTLDDITEMIRGGGDIYVTDHESGDDLTTLTLTQIILEQEKKTTGFLPRTLLTSLIRTGGDTLDQVVRSLQSVVIASEEDAENEEEDAFEAVEAESDAEVLSDEKGVSASLTAVDERISDVLHMLNVPTHRDMRQLQEQLDILGKQLERLAVSGPEPVQVEKTPAQDDSQPAKESS